MTNEIERELIGALRGFLANIQAVAERAAVQAVRSAFARASPVAARSVLVRASPMGYSLGAAQAAATVRPAAPRAPSRRTLTPSERTEAVTRAFAAVRGFPGSTTAQLANILAMRRDQLRAYLRQLADDGAIRIEERRVGRLQRRTYFPEPVELVVNGESDAAGRSMEVTA